MRSLRIFYYNPLKGTRLPVWIAGIALMLNSIGLLIPIFTAAQVRYAAGNGTDTLNLPFERFTINNGLSQGMVRGIVQDKNGYMWFATKDGLNKYDGYTVSIYRNDPNDPFSLPDNQVSGLLLDPNGNLWVGTSTKGLCLFDESRQRFYKVPIINRNKNGFYEDIGRMEYKHGKLFVRLGPAVEIIDVQAVFPLNHEKNITLAKPVFISDNIKLVNPDDPFNFLLLLNNDVLLIATDSCFVLHEKKTGNFTVSSKFNRQYPGSLPWQPDALVADSVRHHYYLPSTYGNNNYQQNFKNIAGLGNSTAYPGFKDSSGKIWVLDTVISLYNPLDKSFKKLSSDDPEIRPLLKNIISYCVDRNGIVWLGTGAYGLLKFDSHLTRFKKFNLGSIYYLNVNNAGRLIYFPPGHKMTPASYDIENEKEDKNLIPANLLKQGWGVGDVTNIVNDNDGNYWMAISTSNNASPGKNQMCLLQYNPSKNRLTEHLNEKKFEGFRYKALIKDNKNQLWILGNDNQKARIIIKYDKLHSNVAALYKFPVDNGLDNYPYISAWWQDSKGVFWFGTRRFGLFRFNEQTNEWKQFKNLPGDSASLPSDKIFSLCPDPFQPAKYLWVGTEGAGFCRFEYSTGKCLRYDEKDGLPNNVVYAILSDANGNLWLSTNHGLSCFILAQARKAKGGASFINFTKSDGIQDNEFNRYSFAQMPGGQLVFGGVNGITWFKPGEVLKKDIPPNLVFTGLSVFNQPVTHKTDSSIINQPIDQASVITLPFSKNMFTISFAALEFSSATKKKYSYYLKGFDKEWINNGAKNEATYTNLDPGTYTFFVKAAGMDGTWGNNAKAITVVIKPPFWLTWWFKALVFVAAASLIYVFYLYRLKQALQVQRMRNRIASDLHDEIGSTLSSISLSSTVIQKMLNTAPVEVKDLLAQISTNTDNMMEAMNDIVWSINTRNDRFDNITARMRAFATSILEPQQCMVNLNVDEAAESLKLNMHQRKNIYLIFKEAINNAAKYAGCKNVHIDIVMQSSKKLILCIKDDGVGFNWRSDGAPITTAAHQGNGLMNMQKRAGELKGSIIIHSVPGQGTELVVQIPV